MPASAATIIAADATTVRQNRGSPATGVLQAYCPQYRPHCASSIAGAQGTVIEPVRCERERLPRLVCDPRPVALGRGGFLRRGLQRQPAVAPGAPHRFARQAGQLRVWAGSGRRRLGTGRDSLLFVRIPVCTVRGGERVSLSVGGRLRRARLRPHGRGGDGHLRRGTRARPAVRLAQAGPALDLTRPPMRRDGRWYPTDRFGTHARNGEYDIEEIPADRAAALVERWRR